MFWQRTWLLILNKASACCMYIVTAGFLLVLRKRELLVSRASESSETIEHPVVPFIEK